MTPYLKLTVCLVILTRGCLAQDIGWFWHVTDFHWDTTYHGRRLSCRYHPAKSGPYGDYWCDSPWRLCQDAVNAMKLSKPDVDFILWTGDNVLHGKDEDLSTEQNDAILTGLTNLISEAFPGVPLYPTYGNHDYWPTDQFPPHGNELYNLTLENWRQWINDEIQVKNFLKGAYYTVKNSHGLRIVALNTNFYYFRNKVTKDMKDPADQLQWLEHTLSTADSNGEKVLITGHIPPGIAAPKPKGGFIWMYEHYHEAFSSIILKYSSIIVGLYFGHNHADVWTVYHSSTGDPVVPVFCAPSVTPWRHTEAGSGHNPAVRLVNYRRDDGLPLDISNYYMDLELSNRNNKSEWRLGYNMTERYNIPDVSATSMSSLITRMKSDKSLLQVYNKWRLVNAPDDVIAACDQNCFDQMLCSFSHQSQSEFNRCMNNIASTAAVSISVLIGSFGFVLLLLRSWN